MLNILLIALFAICVAFIFNEGMWGAGVLFCNVLLAAVLATILFEPLANLLESFAASWTYLTDFVAAWLAFAFCLVVLRLSTDLISRHKVKFKKPVDLAGGIIFAVLIGWIMVSFTAFTMHLAPLSRNYLGFREKPDASTFFFSPDDFWLSFIRGQTNGGALARYPAVIFDPPNDLYPQQDDFILKMANGERIFTASRG